MKKKTVLRKYRFSDAHLKQTADNLLLTIRRDQAAFDDRGFSPNKRDELKTMILNFSNFESDEQLEAIKMSATEIRNEARKVLEKKLRTIFLMAKNVFKEGTGRYKEFGNVDVSRQSEEELVRNAKIAEAAATKYFNDLQTEGLTTLRIQELADAREALDNAIDEQLQAIRNRDITTEARIELGNSLYDLVVKYADIGKDIWYDDNEAKYNDYVIYDTPTAEATETEEEEADGENAPPTGL